MDIKLLDEYNKLLSRYKMAVIYLDSKEVDINEKEKLIQSFQKLTIQLNMILKQVKEENIQYTDIEVTEGFHIEFRIARHKRYNY